MTSNHTSGHTVHIRSMEDMKSKALHAGKFAEQRVHGHCISTKLSGILHGVHFHIAGHSGQSRDGLKRTNGCDLVLGSCTRKPGIMEHHEHICAHQYVYHVLLLYRHKDCSTKARGQASTCLLTLRARLKKGHWTALRTAEKTLVSCQPELGAGQT